MKQALEYLVVFLFMAFAIAASWFAVHSVVAITDNQLQTALTSIGLSVVCCWLTVVTAGLYSEG